MPLTAGRVSQSPELTNFALRPPEKVMRLDRMGSSFPTRLSFMRSLIRRMSREGWSFDRLRFEVDDDGYGVSIYAAHTTERTYSLVVFTNELDPQERSDRVIAEAWDATFSLFDGIPSVEDTERLRANTPKQEAGRFCPSELVLARANKSLRLFEHVVSSLAQGRQPDLNLLASVGYLMRTTAVYGSGKFGCADREKISGRKETRGAFQVEMLCVYLIRWFTIDLVEHIARCQGGSFAVPLAPEPRRFLGIGNATGLGMAPFLINHPVLIHKWVSARETALARVGSLESVSSETIEKFTKLVDRTIKHVEEWKVEDKLQKARITRLREDLESLIKWTREDGNLHQPFPWESLYCFANTNFSLEGQELAVSLMLEPHGELVDDLSDHMHSSYELRLNPAMSVECLKELIEEKYGWALGIDFEDPEAQRHFWYYSEEKLEPRFGNREVDPGEEHEMPLAVGRDVSLLFSILNKVSAEETVGEFVIDRPEFRHIVRRVQSLVGFPYAEIRDNLVGDGMRPLDLLRFKLAFFGASKFDPKSDLWTRITMFQGAPLPEELDEYDPDDWAFPVQPS